MAPSSSPLLANLIKTEKGLLEAYKHQIKDEAAVSAALAAWGVSEGTDMMEMTHALGKESGQLIGAKRQLLSTQRRHVNALKELSKHEGNVRIIARDREILVSRLLKLSQKKVSTAAGREHEAETHERKLEEAQRELAACEEALRHQESILAQERRLVIKDAWIAKAEGIARVGEAMMHCSQFINSILQNIHIDGRHPSLFAQQPEMADEDAMSVMSDHTTISLAPSMSASQGGLPGRQSVGKPSHTYRQPRENGSGSAAPRQTLNWNGELGFSDDDERPTAVVNSRSKGKAGSFMEYYERPQKSSASVRSGLSGTSTIHERNKQLPPKPQAQLVAHTNDPNDLMKRLSMASSRPANGEVRPDRPLSKLEKQAAAWNPAQDTFKSSTAPKPPKAASFVASSSRSSVLGGGLQSIQEERPKVKRRLSDQPATKTAMHPVQPSGPTSLAIDSDSEDDRNTIRQDATSEHGPVPGHANGSGGGGFFSRIFGRFGTPDSSPRRAASGTGGFFGKRGIDRSASTTSWTARTDKYAEQQKRKSFFNSGADSSDEEAALPKRSLVKVTNSAPTWKQSSDGHATLKMEKIKVEPVGADGKVIKQEQAKPAATTSAAGQPPSAAVARPGVLERRSSMKSKAGSVMSKKSKRRTSVVDSQPPVIPALPVSLSGNTMQEVMAKRPAPIEIKIPASPKPKEAVLPSSAASTYSRSSKKSSKEKSSRATKANSLFDSVLSDASGARSSDSHGDALDPKGKMPLHPVAKTIPASATIPSVNESATGRPDNARVVSSASTATFMSARTDISKASTIKPSDVSDLESTLPVSRQIKPETSSSSAVVAPEITNAASAKGGSSGSTADTATASEPKKISRMSEGIEDWTSSESEDDQMTKIRAAEKEAKEAKSGPGWTSHIPAKDSTETNGNADLSSDDDQDTEYIRARKAMLRADRHEKKLKKEQEGLTKSPSKSSKARKSTKVSA